MSRLQERRRFPRHDHCAPITYCHLHATSQTSRPQHQGVLLGHGAGGLRFQSREAIRPGTTLLIKLDCSAEPPPGPDNWEGLRTVTLAEVTWCQPVSDDVDSDHMVGAKYFNPYF